MTELRSDVSFFYQVWNLFRNSDRIKKMVVDKIQQESLRTYLFTYSGIYDSLSLTKLAEMFKLDKFVVHSTISKMIINEDLMVSFYSAISSSLTRSIHSKFHQ